MTIDVLSETVGKQRPVHRIKRPARP
jgi:hypothetical protein